MEAYFSDIGWSYSYLRGSNPAHLEFVLAYSGYGMPGIKTACELAFGQGLTLNINAATSRATKWYGTDFNTDHACTAERLAATCGNGATVLGCSFSELSRVPDLPNFDLVILSGTWSWVGDEDRRAIIDFVDDHLAEGGMFILHYEALPGALDHSYLRNLILDHIGAVSVSGSEMADRVPNLIEELRQIVRLNPVFMGDYPDIDDLLAELKTMPTEHVAHEYFNHNWKPFRYSEIAAMMNAVGLEFTTLIDPIEQVDAIHLTAPQLNHLDSIKDRNVREAIRDFFVRRSGRTDCWIRSPEKLTDTERNKRLSAMRFVRTRNQPLNEIALYGALGEFVLGQMEFQTVVDALPIGEIVEMHKILQAMPDGTTIQDVSDRVALLIAAQLIEPVPASRNPSEEDIACSRLLNTELTRIAAGGEDISTFAAPILAGGYSINSEDRPFLYAYLNGARDRDQLAALAETWHAARADRNDMKVLNQHHILRAQADAFLERTLPILETLAIL